MPHELTADGLGRRLRERWIWRDVRLALGPGDRGVLMGASGSGKTLLLRTLCGLDPPDEGAVSYRGTELSKLDKPGFRAQVLYVQQRPVLIEGSVRANLELPRGFRIHANGALPEGAAQELFERLGKPAGFMEQRASVLSSGEGQVVSLVRALLLNPKLLLLDEPTAHLDPDTTRRVEETLTGWVDEGDRAFLWTSHDPSQVERVRRGPLLRLGEAP